MEQPNQLDALQKAINSSVPKIRRHLIKFSVKFHEEAYKAIKNNKRKRKK